MEPNEDKLESIEYGHPQTVWLDPEMTLVWCMIYYLLAEREKKNRQTTLLSWHIGSGPRCFLVPVLLAEDSAAHDQYGSLGLVKTCTMAPPCPRIGSVLISSSHPECS